ncbi:dolichyldiphosphatase 1-like isoform X2 [Amphibalanus amphitrite]|uniref:dolichyldiphosphatase 1-like isoform X2 n=1 Tax=Amphibalanus amphitrite TaxID=1232801 RepID=UPI001C8FB742|nr:dolichyldiphosphatase 1-like isoform X2 [Amphibalanus amphitrite]
MDDRQEWRDFALTHVEYLSGDFIGKTLCLFSLLPQAMIVSIVTLVVFKRDLHTISFALGVAVCELLNIMLKHWIREERPARKRTSFGHYGMPSDHAQISWFMAGYLTLFLLVRVYLQYHTWWQVVCGGGVGLALAVVWFILVHYVFTPCFPQIVQWRVCELLLICDTTLIPCVMWFEYANIRQEARARQRKLHPSSKSQ